MLKSLKSLVERITKYDSLVKEYERAADNVSRPAKAYINWGLFKASTGNFLDAIEKFQASTQISPYEPEGYTNWGVALAKMGQYQEAIEKFKLAAKANPNYSQVYVLWGAALAELNDLDEARRKYEKAIELAPTNTEAYINWGVALARQHQYDQAIEKFKTALSINSNIAQAHFLLGAVSAEMGNYKEAITRFETTIHIVPDHAEAYHFLGVALNKVGNYQDAIEKSQSAIQLNVSKAEAFINQADAYSNLRNFEKAIERYKIALEINPNSVEAYNGLGVTLNRMGRADLAVEKFRKSLEIAPDNMVSHFFLGSTLADLNCFDEAVAEYELVYQFNNKHLDNLINYGISLHRMSQNHAALDKFMEAKVLSPDLITINFFIGSIFSEMNEFEKAIPYYELALKQEPRHIDSNINLAIALNQLGKTDDAIRRMRNLVKAFPENSNINFVYGVILAKDSNKLKDAVDRFKRTIELDPTFVDAYLAQGELLLKLKRTAEATRVFANLLEFRPDLPSALFMFGVSYGESAKMIEDKPEFKDKWKELCNKAVEFYEKAINKDPDHLEAQANLIYIKAKLGELDLLDSRFTELIEKYPQKRPLIMLYWGQSYDFFEMKDKALEKFTAAVRLDSSLKAYLPEGY